MDIAIGELKLFVLFNPRVPIAEFDKGNELLLGGIIKSDCRWKNNNLIQKSPRHLAMVGLW